MVRSILPVGIGMFAIHVAIVFVRFVLANTEVLMARATNAASVDGVR